MISLLKCILNDKNVMFQELYYDFTFFRYLGRILSNIQALCPSLKGGLLDGGLQQSLIIL